MKCYRLTPGIICIVALATSLAATSAASAFVPTYKPSTKQSVKGEGGAASLEVAGTGSETIECQADKVVGEITGESTDGGVLVTFEGCVGKSSGGSTCKAMSLGASSEGLIKTTALAGLLGEVAASEDKSLAGVDFTPESGKVFTTVLGSCIVETQVRGSLAGEVTPVNISQSTSKTTFVGAKGVESIKKITTKAGGETPELKAFGTVASSVNLGHTININININVQVP